MPNSEAAASRPYLKGVSGLRFAELHPLLQTVLEEAAKDADFTITQGWRSNEAQQAAFDAGRSKARPGKSAHNQRPALAADLLPYPWIDKANDPSDGWNNLRQFRVLAAVILGAAKRRKIAIRWGGDWNMNGSEADEKGLRDFPHFELHPWRSFIK